MTADLPPLPAGIYEHYRGDEYLVLGYCDDSTDHGCTCPPHDHGRGCPNARPKLYYVAYISLRQIMDSKPRLSWHVREQSQFHELTCWTRGCHSWGHRVRSDHSLGLAEQHHHKVQPRFHYVRPA